MMRTQATAALLDVAPLTPAPLDPAFRPALLANRNYRAAVAAAPRREPLNIALERENGLVTRRDLELLPLGGPHDAETLHYVERTVKFLLWGFGGWKLYLAGPEPVCAAIREAYRPGGSRGFDADIMARAYDRPFEVVVVPPADLPPEKTSAAAIGGHLDGCRVGFDLGASDYKLAAVRDGTPVFTTELPWNPSVQSDPHYHVRHIAEGLRLAAQHLPRVEAIGGSSAGIYVNNQPKVASLFRSVPAADFARVIKPMFLNLQREWGVPLVVVNDGDVTALAGGMSLGRNAVLGVADKVIEAVKAGAIKHFFLVGGCDGAKMGRDYYTEFTEAVPKDCVILTLACGKYRFNKLDFGTIDGIPRLLDVGQCNDAYSAVEIATALAAAFQCGVNDLPLSFIVSWYEQKAVAILLTLLHLGVKNIRLGPSLPAFVTPPILKVLQDNFNVMPIGDAKKDLAACLG